MPASAVRHYFLPFSPVSFPSSLESIKSHELLGLVDALRVGRIHEQQLAAVALQERLGATP